MKENEVIVRTNGSTAGSLRPGIEDFTIPETDIIETPEAYLVLVDMPGALKDQITLKVEQNELSLYAPVLSHHQPDARVIHCEIRTNGYHRRFTIGDGVDRANIDARYDQGVLTVKLFKSEKMKAREITIN